jgi:hypothetical protein
VESPEPKPGRKGARLKRRTSRLRLRRAATRIGAAAGVTAIPRATVTARATTIWAIIAGTSTRRSTTSIAATNATTAVARPRPLEAVEVEVVEEAPLDTDPPVFQVRSATSVVGVVGGFLCRWSRSGRAKAVCRFSISFNPSRATRPLPWPDVLGALSRARPCRTVEEPSSTSRYARKEVQDDEGGYGGDAG